jgi:2-hydroxy-3-oxopropionate reductase
MNGVRPHIGVDLVQHPPARVVQVLAHVEAQATRIASHRLTGVVQQGALELIEQLRAHGQLDQDDVHGVKGLPFGRFPKPYDYTVRMPSTIGFIGLGLMGRPMAKNLLAAGYPLVVHSRSPGPVDDVVAAGATRGASPADVAARATRIITMVPDSPDVEQVLEGKDGVFGRMQPGTIVIDMSSIAPGVARRLAARAEALGGTMLDAPVSGGDIGAINGTLSIMVGGSAAAFAEVKPLLDVMGNPERVVHIGESGAGQLCKLCNQMVIGGTLAVVAEAFALANKAGVDATKVREALLGGFAQSRVLDIHGERVLKGNYKPGFKTHLYAKDMRNVVATLAEYDTPAPVSAIVQQLVHASMAAGRGEDDNSVMAKAVMEMAGIRRDW